MAIDALVKPLLSLPLFQGLAPDRMARIARRAERIIYRPGDVIIAEDRPSDAAIVVVAGTCLRIESARGSGERFGEGTMIAELAMLVEVVHSSTIIAESQVKALKISRERMGELFKDDPALADHFSSRILTRLYGMADELRNVDVLLRGPVDVAATGASLPAFRARSE